MSLDIGMGVGIYLGASSSFVPGVSFSGTGELSANSSNFIVGTVTGNPIDPSSVAGDDVYYFGSFGQMYWNARFGAAGLDRPLNAASVDIQLNGASISNLPWNISNSRFENTAGEDLWAILGPDLGNTVPWSLKFIL